jgi:hypothetical protein
MIMFDQSRRLSEPLRWGRREKTVVAALLSVTVLALAALAAYALSSGAPARRDCIDITFPSTLGGAELRGCGAQARRECTSGGFPHLQQELAEACRRAGFPFVGAG